MLKRFEVENYKNFKEKIVLDFNKVGGYQFSTDCVTGNMLSKLIIYGRNATGKTNLGRALFDISNNISRLRFFSGRGEIYLNADSPNRCAEFKYIFQFGEDELIYRYKKVSEYVLEDEELILNGDNCFYYNFETKESNFEGLKLLDADTVVLERYLEASEENESDEREETLSFLRWLIGNTALQPGSVLLKLNDFVKRMQISTVSTNRSIRMFDAFFESLEEPEALKDFEDFLNMLGVECKLVTKRLPDGRVELYFKHERLVPFYESASSGTLVLMNLYRRLNVAKEASILYLDEFDAFYNYEMSENVVLFLKKKYPKCQVILTTHNTNLMTNKLMRPDCLFILSRKGTLTPLNLATARELREGHNLEKLYISGEFEKYE